MRRLLNEYKIKGFQIVVSERGMHMSDMTMMNSEHGKDWKNVIVRAGHLP